MNYGPVILQQLELFKSSHPLLGEPFCKEMEEKVSSLARYAALLAHWTQRVDLISPAPPEMLVSRHIVDSVAAGVILSRECKLPLQKGYLDVGSGAGLPGVVLSVMEPNRPALLLEPRYKRCTFLREVRRKLGLNNLSILQDRLENVSRETLPEIGLLITRATGLSEELALWAPKFLSPGGFLAQMVAKPPTSLLPDTKLFPYSLPPDSAQRNLLINCFT